MADGLSIRDFARKLRREQTDAERRLWSHLRGKQVGFKFRRQHPIGSFVVDFCCVERRLIIEVDGGQHREAVIYDEARTRTLASRGYKVLRFSDMDVLLDISGVVEQIIRELRNEAQSPGKL